MRMKLHHLAEKNAFLYTYIHSKLVAAKAVFTRTPANDASDWNVDKTAFLTTIIGINA